ncbi:MAG: DNA adenine methylase [Geitlerinemataceae cyanobacterium]
MLYTSPLRYPGGKRKLANFVKLIYRSNNLLDSEYLEPYAGGASIALHLLYDEYVRYIHINDIDISIFAFWHSAIYETQELCDLIRNVPVTIEEWRKQKSIQLCGRDDINAVSMVDFGFSTFFLNRTNRSGIINGGVIGGKNQDGKWKIDARFNKEDLIERIKKIGRYRDRIHLSNLDALDFLDAKSDNIKPDSLIYLDPPYFMKGAEDLYMKFYKQEDHLRVSKKVKKLKNNWVISYDNAPEIRRLYSECKSLTYDIHYSARKRYRGTEVMFFSKKLRVPDLPSPTSVENSVFQLELLRD